jgi:hypothetical protein
MAYYRIAAKDNDQGDAYWVTAGSKEQARRLVALNAEQAREAEDPTKFKAEINGEKQPPFGLIYRRLYGPLTVAKRGH